MTTLLTNTTAVAAAEAVVAVVCVAAEADCAGEGTMASEIRVS
jgi:hypothetical protein